MTDARLNATNDPMWMRVILRADDIRSDTLRVLAEAWNEDPERVGELLGRLADVVGQGGPAWDAAVLDLESDLQMDDAEISLNGDEATRLADELDAAAARTLGSRLRNTTPAEPLTFPHQQDRRHAA